MRRLSIAGEHNVQKYLHEVALQCIVDELGKKGGVINKYWGQGTGDRGQGTGDWDGKIMELWEYYIRLFVLDERVFLLNQGIICRVCELLIFLDL